MEGTTSKPRAVATRPAVLDDPDPGRTVPDEQRTDIVITAHARHLTATAVDLTSEAVPANGDLVSLRLQRDSTRIAILGSLAELDDLVAEITAEVDRIHRQRADAADECGTCGGSGNYYSDNRPIPAMYLPCEDCGGTGRVPTLLAQLEASVVAAKTARAKARPGEPVNTLSSLLPPPGPEAA